MIRIGTVILKREDAYGLGPRQSVTVQEQGCSSTAYFVHSGSVIGCGSVRYRRED
jgi:hypothetical protein